MSWGCSPLPLAVAPRAQPDRPHPLPPRSSRLRALRAHPTNAGDPGAVCVVGRCSQERLFRGRPLHGRRSDCLLLATETSSLNSLFLSSEGQAHRTTQDSLCARVLAHPLGVRGGAATSGRRGCVHGRRGFLPMSSPRQAPRRQAPASDAGLWLALSWCSPMACSGPVRWRLTVRRAHRWLLSEASLPPRRYDERCSTAYNAALIQAWQTLAGASRLLLHAQAAATAASASFQRSRP